MKEIIDDKNESSLEENQNNTERTIDDEEDSENVINQISEDSEQQEGEDDTIVENYTLQYRVHVQDIGWQNWVSNGELAGTTGKAKQLEAVEIVLLNEQNEVPENIKIEYRAHVEDIGWQDWVSNGELAGTTGRAKQLEAIQIRLSGENSEQYVIEYQTHVQDFGWMGYVTGENCSGSAGFAKQLEALRISLRKSDEVSNVDGTRGYLRAYDNSELYLMGHIQDVGDVTGIAMGGTLGTTGKCRRIEGLTVYLDDSSLEVAQGSINYSTHVQDYGWLDFVEDGVYSGTKGECKQVEAIKIELSGEIAEYYDIYYRAHVQEIGWMGWAKNGQAAGTAGYFYRMEAVQIKLVVKGGAAPGANKNYFKDKADMSSLIEVIKTYAGSKYLYGGTTPSGWDCSGCMQWLYKNIFGISIPRTSREQAKTGSAVSISDMSKWQPGDLIFFGGTSVSHVAMYLGDGLMIHALNSTKGTRIDDVKWFDKADTTTVMMAVRRIL